MSGALETLCGQAYGAKEYVRLGVYLQAGMAATFVCAIPISILWLYAEPVLIFIGQDAGVSAMASTYLRCLIPGLFAYAMMQSFMKFLQTQSIVMPLTLCSICPFVLHFILCYLLVYKTALGFQGAALATSISFWLIVICLLLYMKFSRSCQKTWGGFSYEAFKVIGPFLKLAIQSAIMVWGVDGRTGPGGGPSGGVNEGTGDTGGDGTVVGQGGDPRYDSWQFFATGAY
eukprot:Gb_02018 [translate_table: standard]